MSILKGGGGLSPHLSAACQENMGWRMDQWRSLAKAVVGGEAQVHICFYCRSGRHRSVGFACLAQEALARAADTGRLQSLVVRDSRHLCAWCP